VQPPRWRYKPTLAAVCVASAALLGPGLFLLRPRPQPPETPPVPFREEEVHFSSGGNTLAGVLVLPTTPGPHPAVVFVNGSGETDRTGHGLCPPLWRHFARHGFASLSWDRPGVGRSTGDFEQQTFPDRAAEALTAVRLTRSACGASARAASSSRWPPRSRTTWPS
jgi:alpha-beta hydrolase superfamily lysophospholipase